MSVKTELISLIRRLGLSTAADHVRYRLLRFKNRKLNNAFKADYPGVVLPPPFMMYESFLMDYRKYYIGGREDAEWIISLAKPYCKFENINILDWGCGPSRIIRHLPDILGKSNFYFGTDYNADTIAWCAANIPEIKFSKNNLTPPLPYQENQFDLLYGISILTHLSEGNHYAWSNELYRVLAPKGIAILTTHGDAFMEKLTPSEVETYRNRKLILRDKAIEGQRTYGAFHPPTFIRNVFEKSGFTICEHIPGKRVNENYISQDVWILKKGE